MENEVLKAIKERRSIRRYKADQITDEELKTVLEAGTWAATGHGSQEPFIIAVQNPETCAQLRQMNAKAMGVESDPYYGAPTIVIVLAREDDPNNVKDGSLILGNMMLAAHSIGLSSCWINREDIMFATEKGKKLMKDWNLPEGLMGVGALSLGYASAHPHIVKPRKEDYETFCNDSYDNYSYDSFQKRFFTTLHEMYIIYYINIYNNNIKYILINRKQEKVGYSRKNCHNCNCHNCHLTRKTMPYKTKLVVFQTRKLRVSLFN